MTLGDPVYINIGTTVQRKSRTKNWYIGERHNPQFDKPYYRAYGQLSKVDAKNKGKSIYGSMYILEFSSQEEYENKINELRQRGFRVS